MSGFAFNDRNIRWQTVEGLDHLWLSILDVDEENKILHVLFKFAANQKIVLHRHKVLNKTMVIQGEHRLYHANGDVKEVRPTGSYTVSPASDDPHQEGGGDQDVIILFTIYGAQNPLYELLDADQNIIGSLSMQDFVELKKNAA